MQEPSPRQLAWMKFAAAAFTDPNIGVAQAAALADELLDQYDSREDYLGHVYALSCSSCGKFRGRNSRNGMCTLCNKVQKEPQP